MHHVCTVTDKNIPKGPSVIQEVQRLNPSGSGQVRHLARGRVDDLYIHLIGQILGVAGPQNGKAISDQAEDNRVMGNLEYGGFQSP